MTAENRIAEMIMEIEQTFAERDALYKDRDEAVSRMLESLKQREELLGRKEETLQQKEETLQSLSDTLQEKEEKLLGLEKSLQQESERLEKESQEIRGKLDEEQISIKLLKVKLQNEKVRLQMERDHFEERTGKTAGSVEDLNSESARPENTQDSEEVHKLLEENEGLKERILELEKQRMDDSEDLEILRRQKDLLEKECSDLQSEKKDLFRRLLKADDVLSEDEGEEEEEIEYLPEEKDDEEEVPSADADRIGELLACSREEYPGQTVESFRMEDGRRGVRIETEEFHADILCGERSYIEIGIPLEDNRKLRKAISRINGEGGVKCRYERSRKEALLTVPFQEEDEPADVLNLMRCVLDYEVPALVREGGSK